MKTSAKRPVPSTDTLPLHVPGLRLQAFTGRIAEVLGAEEPDLGRDQDRPAPKSIGALNDTVASSSVF